VGNYETFHANECFGQDNSIKYLVLIIYDISSNKRRTKMAKLLESYGFRVQRSAFEAVVSMPEYLKLLKRIDRLVDEQNDYVRVYRLTGNTQISTWGSVQNIIEEDVLII
jgi:CRISPR-associated protein Cas2